VYGDVDEALFNALRRLTPDQRVAVVMVHMYGFSYREVAELTEASESAVTNYVHRGMNRLRVLLAQEEER
jgi:RNA polymerase sigma-70 factor (ECF subfamily)